MSGRDGKRRRRAALSPRAGPSRMGAAPIGAGSLTAPVDLALQSEAFAGPPSATP